MPKSKKHSMQLQCNAACLVEACKDEGVNRSFHQQVKDIDFRTQPWCQTENQAFRRASWTSPISSTAAQFATGATQHTVQEATTIAALPENNFRILTEVRLGGNPTFSKCSAKCILELRSCNGDRTVDADAVITVNYAANDYSKSTMESNILEELKQGLVKWMKFATKNSFRFTPPACTEKIETVDPEPAESNRISSAIISEESSKVPRSQESEMTEEAVLTVVGSSSSDVETTTVTTTESSQRQGSLSPSAKAREQVSVMYQDVLGSLAASQSADRGRSERYVEKQRQEQHPQ